MGAVTDQSKRLSDVIERNRLLYSDPNIDATIQGIISPSPQSGLSEWDILRILRHSQSVFFDTHIEVVSGQHTATYLRFESIAQYPQLIRVIARGMGKWIAQLTKNHRIEGIVAPASEARLLAEGIAAYLEAEIPLRVVLAPFDHATGKIGTDVPSEAIREGEHFLALNDVTARGNCVNKLGQIVTDRGGNLVGMMVCVRRDSGQFPFMEELTAQYPFYFGAALDMPQWDPSDCPLCRAGETLFSWKDMPFLLPDGC